MIRQMIKYLPVTMVAVVLGVSIMAYPFVSRPKATIKWNAASKYFTEEFASAGFAISCDVDSGSCKVTWSVRNRTRRSVPLPVYECDREGQFTRDDVLVRFIERGRQHSLATVALEAAPILDGFFQSGLRRACDAASRRARERLTVSTRLPPFELGEFTGNSGDRLVKALEPAFGSISTGLPQRPEYVGDFVASAGWNEVGSGANVSVITLIRPSGGGSSIVLDANSPNACTPVWPGGRDQTRCNSVAVLPCDPNVDAACRRPAAHLFGMRNGQVLVRVGVNTESRALSKTLDRLAEDDLLVLRPDAPDLFIGGSTPDRSFLIRSRSGNTLPISRLRMVNGRWQRWFETSIEYWLEPVVRQYDALVRNKAVTSDQRVELTLNLGLQGQLERDLARWMSQHVEGAVVSHLRQHFSDPARSLLPTASESDHRRPVPEAGITVLDSDSGAVLAVASYPPADALVSEDGSPAFAPGWQERFADRGAPRWAIRQILQALEDRLQNSTNSNFVAHPIGSTFKPILLSLMIDEESPLGGIDGLGRLFDLVVAGHGGTGGNRMARLSCSNSRECLDPRAEPIAGLPIGPWGQEEGTHGGAWIGRHEFLIGSCNKFAVTVGLLSLFDWNNTRRGNALACCWNPVRDSFGFAPVQVGRTVSPVAGTAVHTPTELPPIGSGIEVWDGHIANTPTFADSPPFVRLQHYFGVSPRSRTDDYDSSPWTGCPGGQRQGTGQVIGTVTQPQLYLSRFPVGVFFTNFFTGSGPNWWSNLKLAEAYTRLAMNHPISATFCAQTPPVEPLFQNRVRQAELVKILSRQRTASWVHTPVINAWEREAAHDRAALSKTGTSLRHDNHKSTGIFAILFGNATSHDVSDHLPTALRHGLVIVAHVDDVGGSALVTELVDSVFHILRERFER
jgi:hypothetical protein